MYQNKFKISVLILNTSFQALKKTKKIYQNQITIDFQNKRNGLIKTIVEWLAHA